MYWQKYRLTPDGPTSVPSVNAHTAFRGLAICPFCRLLKFNDETETKTNQHTGNTTDL
jgi:hypothetical protein